jgi:hypothetical protein
MKVETDIIASITESSSGYAVIMYVETFKTEVYQLKYYQNKT